ncbi:hypothetical protein VNO77_20101 [Canavalia gladiata]|uniref:Uncharacterized protein n=1 Tax=Canavalia gladiata TaxID=3824 RepID=A0AAN9LP14_CANGL
MESNQIFSKEKLGFLGILKEAVKITLKNPKFVIFTCLTSLPLLFSSFMYESMFMQTLIEATKVLVEEDKSDLDCTFCNSWKPLMAVDHLIGKVSHNLLLLIFSQLGIIHLCDFLNTVATVNSVSVIYPHDHHSLSLHEMFTKHVIDSRLKGPLITSIYTLLLTSMLSIGLFSLLLYIYFVNRFPLFMMLFSLMFVALFGKYLEWSAVWDTGIVISILEEKEGDVALVIAANLSKGNRSSGILFVIGSLLWRQSLRLVCLFIAWNTGGSKMLISVLQIILFFLANIIKWVFFVVYYVDCKKRRSEKEVSIEGGQGVLSV